MLTPTVSLLGRAPALRRTLLFVAGLFVLAARVDAQSHAASLDATKRFEQYMLDSWESDQGLPQTTVYSLAQRSDGYLWLGLQAGLVRFDGVAFKTYTSATSPGLPEGFINALYVDRSDNLWIGTESGLTSRATGSTFVPTANDFTGSVMCFLQDRSGALWAGVSNGIAKLDHGRFVSVAGISDSVISIREEHDGSLVVATSGGLFTRRGDHFVPLTLPANVRRGSVQSTLRDHRGALWIGGPTGLLRVTGNRVERFGKANGLPSTLVNYIYELRDGQLWIGTKAGLARFTGTRFESFTSRDGLEGSDVSQLYEDREGSVWVATLNGGLNRFRDPIFTPYGKAEGLPNDMPWSVFGDRSGTVWVGMEGDGLVRMQGDVVTRIPKSEGLPATSVYATAETPDGTIWAATRLGVSRLRKGKWEVVKELSNTGKWIGALLVDRSGALWIGGQFGLARWSNDTLRFLTAEAGIEKSRVWTMTEDRAGALWIGTMGEGLIRYENGHFAKVTTKDGLSNDIIQALAVDDRGLWIGTRFGGLQLLRDGRITTLPFRLDHPLVDINSVVSDAKGNLWISSSQGIFFVERDELAAALGGRHGNMRVREFGRLDGLRRIEFNSAGTNSAWTAPDGRIWFPTVRGLAVADAEHVRPNPVPPPVHITHLRANGKELDPARVPEIPPGAGELEFTYTATSLLIPSRVRFKYKLEGYDTDWIDAGNRRVASYSHLQGGHYRFRVIAANNDGVWNEAGTSADVELKLHFYERGWFYVLCAVGVIALVAGVVHLRVRQVSRRARALTALVDERTAELRTSEERYRSLFDANPQPVWVHDAESLKILAVNRAAVEQYGYTRDELVGMRVTDIRIADEGGHVTPAHERDGTTSHGRDRKKDGTIIDVEVAMHDMVYAGRAAVLMASSDVTARRDLEERLRQSQKMEAVGQLAGGIAHDLNNVLTAVMAHVDLAVEELRPDEPVVADLKQAQSAAHRGANMIRKLLGFSRRERLVLKPLDLGNLASELAVTMRRMLPTNIEIQLSQPNGLPAIAADAGAVQQMVLNLATNARDAMPNGGTLRVELSQTLFDATHVAIHGWGRPGRYVTLAVTDTGIGMDEQTLARIFEPYFSTKSVGHGSGLGMAMVFGLMKQHSGYVHAESDLGVRTIVRLYFPAIAASAATPNATSTTTSLVRAHETVLVVEDEAGVRTAMTRSLARLGYRVMSAVDGREGLDIWRTNADEIDLVISDAIMPRMGGLALLEAIRRERSGVRFLLTSGYTAEQVSEGSPALIDVPLLPKPWTMSELVERVRATLEEAPVG